MSAQIKVAITVVKVLGVGAVVLLFATIGVELRIESACSVQVQSVAVLVAIRAAGVLKRRSVGALWIGLFGGPVQHLSGGLGEPLVIGGFILFEPFVQENHIALARHAGYCVLRGCLPDQV